MGPPTKPDCIGAAATEGAGTAAAKSADVCFELFDTSAAAPAPTARPPTAPTMAPLEIEDGAGAAVATGWGVFAVVGAPAAAPPTA